MTDAEFVKKTRKAYGMTQEQFAEKFYVSRQTVQNWEYGRALPKSMKELIQLRAEKDGVKIDDNKNSCAVETVVIGDKEIPNSLFYDIIKEAKDTVDTLYLCNDIENKNLKRASLQDILEMITNECQ